MSCGQRDLLVGAYATIRWTRHDIIVYMKGEYPIVPTPRTIRVEPGSELDRLLDEAGETPVELERGGIRYRLNRVAADTTEDIWAGYDPNKVRASMRAAAGSWRDIDTEALKAELYRARGEGSRPLDRP